MGWCDRRDYASGKTIQVGRKLLVKNKIPLTQRSLCPFCLGLIGQVGQVDIVDYPGELSCEEIHGFLEEKEGH